MFTFIAPHQIKDLKNLKLGFQTLTSLNDPFINNKKIHRSHEETAMSESEFEQALNNVYQSMEPNIKAMVTFEYYLQQAIKNRHKIEPTLVAARKPSVPMPNIKYYSKVACLRLFSNISQSHLWDQYGCSHKSIAIQLDIRHDYFTRPKFDAGPQLFKPVKYDDLRPEAASRENPFPALLSQPEHCAYEQEWRLIRSLSADFKAKGLAEFKIPRQIIKSIYLGLECETPLVEEMAQLVKADMQFKHVSLHQMAVSETHLRLQPLNLKQYL